MEFLSGRNKQSKVSKRYKLMIYPLLLGYPVCWHIIVLAVSYGSLYFSGKNYDVSFFISDFII